MRPNTLANYEGYLKKHLLPYFGARDICTITIDDVQEFMNSKAAYSKKMIEELLLTLGMILNAAKEDGLISINPAKSKRLHNPSTKKTVREALTSAEADDKTLQTMGGWKDLSTMKNIYIHTQKKTSKSPDVSRPPAGHDVAVYVAV